MTVSSTTRPPLRIGLLIDSFSQRKWIHKIIEEIQASGFAEIVVLIKNEAESAPDPGRLKSYWRNRNYLLYAFYTKLDERRVKVEPDAFATSDITPLLPDCPVVKVKPEMKKFSDWFPEETVKEIRAYDLNVALSFGFRILKGEALKIARHGVWSFHHGDNQVNRGGPAGFWEVMDGVPVTGSVLQILTEDLDNGVVIYRSLSPTADRFSVKANRNNLYWKSCAFVMRKLKDLAAGRPLCTPEIQTYRPYSNRLYRMPTNAEMFPRLSRLATQYVGGKFRSAFSGDQWALAYRFRTSPGDLNNTLYRFKNLTPPKELFWADPSAIKAGDRYYVFIEEYLYAKEKGHISVIELDPKRGMVGDPRIVLERDYHLSYPFVFEWNGEYFMVPESAANKTVELYRCTSFPFEWKLEKVLMTDVRAKDATLVEVDGLWWMFVSIAENCIPDELSLFYAKTPLGPWTPHPRNPVKSDVRGSRPAGALFEWNGEIYRPAQNSSGRYGYAMSINRVTKLDRESFQEEEVSTILPNWNKNLLGTHTLSIAGDLTVVDCLMKRSRWS